MSTLPFFFPKRAAAHKVGTEPTGALDTCICILSTLQLFHLLRPFITQTQLCSEATQRSEHGVLQMHLDVLPTEELVSWLSRAGANQHKVAPPAGLV